MTTGHCEVLARIKRVTILIMTSVTSQGILNGGQGPSAIQDKWDSWGHSGSSWFQNNEYCSALVGMVNSSGIRK